MIRVSFIRIEDVRKRERGDFLSAQSSLEAEPNHHSVMRIFLRRQQRLDLIHAQKLRQRSMLARHDVVHHGLAADGINVGKETGGTFDRPFLIAKRQSAHPSLMLCILVELAHIVQPLTGC